MKTTAESLANDKRRSDLKVQTPHRNEAMEKIPRGPPPAVGDLNRQPNSLLSSKQPATNGLPPAPRWRQNRSFNPADNLPRPDPRSDLGFEILDGFSEAFGELNLRLPFQVFLGESNVRPALFRVVGR